MIPCQSSLKGLRFTNLFYHIGLSFISYIYHPPPSPFLFKILSVRIDFLAFFLGVYSTTPSFFFFLACEVKVFGWGGFLEHFPLFFWEAGGRGGRSGVWMEYWCAFGWVGAGGGSAGNGMW